MPTKEERESFAILIFGGLAIIAVATLLTRQAVRIAEADLTPAPPPTES